MKQLLLDLDSYGSTDPLGMFPLFFEEDRQGSGTSSCCGISAAPSFVYFPVCGRVANVIPIPKGHLPPQHPIIDQFP